MAVSDSGVGRRFVIKAALNTAWAVPAITMASAVPAFAASTPAMFSLTGTATNTLVSLGTARKFTITGTVTNTGGTSGTPQILISFGLGASLQAPAVAGWSGTTTILSGGITGFVYTYNGTVAPGASVSFNWTITSTLLLLASLRASVSPPDPTKQTVLTA